MKLLLTVLIFVTVACGRDPHVDPELRIVLESYLTTAPDHGHLDDVSAIEFGTPPAGDLAVCEKAGKVYKTDRTITVSREAVGAALWAAVFHELGHCLHDLQHNPRAGSIMYAREVGEAYWQSHFEEESHLMFEGRK